MVMNVIPVHFLSFTLGSTEPQRVKAELPHPNSVMQVSITTPKTQTQTQIQISFLHFTTLNYTISHVFLFVLEGIMIIIILILAR